MKTRAAILRGPGSAWEVETLDLDEPRAGEVLVRMVAAGLCHSDDHQVTGDVPRDYFPYCGGHEGAGIIEAVGPGVRALQPGDHVITSFIPSCGSCRWCSDGRQNLCDRALPVLQGTQLDGTHRMHLDGVAVAGATSTFTEYSVVPERSCVPIPMDIDLAVACLLSCGVPTGWGSATNAANVKGGDVVIIVGAGGIGMNAVQGAALAGAARVIVVDPADFKRTQAPRFGATDVFATIEEATDLARSLTNGQGADSAVICVGVLGGEHITQALAAVAKGGTVAVTGIAKQGMASVDIDLFELAMFQKRIQGVLYGLCSPARDVPRLVDMYRSGRLLLDELITHRYRLDDINRGYADMHAGSTIRGVIDFGQRQ